MPLLVKVGDTKGVMEEFGVSNVVSTLGISLFVLGFAVGPLLWAPLSEILGRRVVFIITFGAMTAFSAGAAVSQNIETLLIMRFFAAAFGSSLLANVSLFLTSTSHYASTDYFAGRWYNSGCICDKSTWYCHGTIYGSYFYGLVGALTVA